MWTWTIGRPSSTHRLRCSSSLYERGRVLHTNRFVGWLYNADHVYIYTTKMQPHYKTNFTHLSLLEHRRPAHRRDRSPRKFGCTVLRFVLLELWPLSHHSHPQPEGISPPQFSPFQQRFIFYSAYAAGVHPCNDATEHYVHRLYVIVTCFARAAGASSSRASDVNERIRVYFHCTKSYVFSCWCVRVGELRNTQCVRICRAPHVYSQRWSRGWCGWPILRIDYNALDLGQCS